MLPTVVLTAHGAVAQNLIGARGRDPVIPEPDEAPRPTRTRVRVAAALRHTADRLAPVAPRAAH